MSSPRVGIIGAGQLGRMLALAAYPLDVRCRFVDREAESPGGQVAPIETAALDDIAALERLATGVDVVTCEIENVSVAALETIAALAPVAPPPAFIGIAQDRLAEKRIFESLEIPTAAFVGIDASGDIGNCARLGWPIVLKARRLGYDGRGQRIAQSLDELAASWDELGNVPAIAEAFVPFDRELSLIAARGRDGASVFYPLTENRHRDGILVASVAPFEDTHLQKQAESWLGALMAQFDYVGVLTVEFFATTAGLVANEIAPRVHNSGHWTIEGAQTSQFENHIRAVVGLPLGSTAPRGHSGMINLIGEMPPREAVLSVPGAHLHGYGKMPRPKRKVGHCTLVDGDRDRLLGRLAELETAFGYRE
jgi:5-(carboxyamino)imidazole ribonucleotide synthase